VAPAFLVYTYGLETLDPIGMIAAALPALCGGVRLARYNVDYGQGEKKDYFEGLPIPGQAIAIVTLVLSAENSSWASLLHLDSIPVLLTVVVILSALMVSSIRFDAIPKPTISYMRAHPRKTAAYVIAGVLIVALQELGLLIVFATYLSFGIGRAVYQLIDALTTPVPDEAS